MRTIVIVMLCVQAALVLVSAWTVLRARPTPGRPRPIWSSLAITLVIAAGTSFQIADKHRPDPGAELLQYGSGLLMGMALMSLLVLLRQRMGTDSAP
jgi:hypothetical protein